jgi:hypothetical protein
MRFLRGIGPRKVVNGGLLSNPAANASVVTTGTIGSGGLWHFFIHISHTHSAVADFILERRDAAAAVLESIYFDDVAIGTTQWDAFFDNMNETDVVVLKIVTDIATTVQGVLVGGQLLPS